MANTKTIKQIKMAKTKSENLNEFLENAVYQRFYEFVKLEMISLRTFNTYM